MTRVNNVKQKHSGLSTVTYTIIILTASIVIASSIVFFSTTMFTNNNNIEAITVTNTKLWVHPSDLHGLAWGVAGITNTGNKPVSVDRIQIHDKDIPYSNWYIDTNVTTTLLQKSFVHPGWSNNNGMLLPNDPDNKCNILQDIEIKIDMDGVGGEDPVCAHISNGPISMIPNQSIIIYFKMQNGTILPSDFDTSKIITIFAGNIFQVQSVDITNP